jgi:hypothetical protein
MALTLPTVEELGLFRGEDFPDDPSDPEYEAAEAVLQQAADAIWVFTGIDSDPVTPGWRASSRTPSWISRCG